MNRNDEQMRSNVPILYTIGTGKEEKKVQLRALPIAKADEWMSKFGEALTVAETRMMEERTPEVKAQYIAVIKDAVQAYDSDSFPPEIVELMNMTQLIHCVSTMYELSDPFLVGTELNLFRINQYKAQK